MLHKIGYLRLPCLSSEIDAENLQMRQAKRRKGRGGMSWDTYHNLSTIEDWMSSLAKMHPEFVSVIQIGFSFEKRPLSVLKFSTGPRSDGREKASVWVSLLSDPKSIVDNSFSNIIRLMVEFIQGNNPLEISAKQINVHLLFQPSKRMDKPGCCDFYCK